jgi:dihydrodiol dehydrogenase / D-xylose 1-dehydrogenase (NADP)
MGSDQFVCRWAFPSRSSIASVFLSDIVLLREDSDPIKHEIVAVSTTGSHERVQKWLAEHNVPNASSVKIYSSWEKMLEEGDFDIMYISTPHPLHYQHVLAALKRKRNVLVEKPATMNRKQYEVLCKQAREQNVVLMEAMWTRYLPATEYFKSELLPKIGQVKRVYAEFSFPIYSSDMPLSSRFLDKAAGAGALLDQGVYALTWADLAFNGIIAENATTQVIHANNIPLKAGTDKIDDINTVILSQINNNSENQIVVGIVTTSMTLPGSNKPSFYHRSAAKKAAPSVRIEAEYASIAVPFPPIWPEVFHVQWYGEEFPDAEGREKDEVIKKPVGRGWGIWYQADVIVRRVCERRGGARQGEVIGEEESLRVLGWMDEARRLSGLAFDPKLEEI